MSQVSKMKGKAKSETEQKMRENEKRPWSIEKREDERRPWSIGKRNKIESGKKPSFMEKRKKKVEINEKKPWSDLPLELLQLITEHLDFADLIRVFAVCKTWQAAAPEISAHRQNPQAWLLSKDIRRACNFYDPWSNKVYKVKPPTVISPRILSSGYGWLLILDQRSQDMFFWHPFSNVKINLPKFSAWVFRVWENYTFAFSSSPTSRNCVVFGLRSHKFSNSIYITTCCFGDESWRSYEFGCSGTYSLRFTNAIFHNGTFYCFNEIDYLGAFNASEGTWTVHDLIGRSITDFFWHMVDYGGELFIIGTCLWFLRIWKVDCSKMACTREINFGGEILVLIDSTGRNGSVVVGKGMRKNISWIKTKRDFGKRFPVIMVVGDGIGKDIPWLTTTNFERDFLIVTDDRDEYVIDFPKNTDDEGEYGREHVVRREMETFVSISRHLGTRPQDFVWVEPTWFQPKQIQLTWS